LPPIPSPPHIPIPLPITPILNPASLLTIVVWVFSSTCEETLELVKDIFASAGERDIYTGDFVDIYVITKDGTK